MKIYLDTNIFYKNWFLESPHFMYLFNFINNESHDLVISKLVIEEIENIRKREINSTIEKIEKEFDFLNKRLKNNISLSIQDMVNEPYSMEEVLKKSVYWLDLVDYNSVPQDEVVKRALHNIRPFQEEEKGYRDTLIWLSLLNYIKEKNSDDEIIFISSNKNDFYDKNKKETVFHSDLLKDLEEKGIKNKLVPYDSLYSFIKNTIDTDLHSFEHLNADFETFLEEEGEDYLKTYDFRGKIVSTRSFQYTINFSQIFDVEVDMFEGLEDPELLGIKKLDENSLYINYRYNLRRVILTLEVLKEEYIKNKSEIDQYFYDKEFYDEFAKITTVIRPYFDVSFIYNPKTETSSHYSVDWLYLG